VRPARRWLLVLAALALLAALIGGVLWLRGDELAGATAAGTPVHSAPAQEGSSTAPTAPTAPRVTTPGEATATDEPAPTAGGKVNVVITQAGWGTSGTAAEVSGFVSGVIEDGGTCRVTMTHDGETVTAEREGLADATTTACGVIEIGDPDMASGWWDAVLSYESPTSSGESEPVAVLVPTR
jgi:hypothetical protein